MRPVHGFSLGHDRQDLGLLGRVSPCAGAHPTSSTRPASPAVAARWRHRHTREPSTCNTAQIRATVHPSSSTRARTGPHTSPSAILSAAPSAPRPVLEGLAEPLDPAARRGHLSNRSDLPAWPGIGQRLQHRILGQPPDLHDRRTNHPVTLGGLVLAQVAGDQPQPDLVLLLGAQHPLGTPITPTHSSCRSGPTALPVCWAYHPSVLHSPRCEPRPTSRSGMPAA